MAIVHVPVEVPEELLETEEVVCVRVPRDGERCLDKDGACVILAHGITGQRLILRPKIQWPANLLWRWVSRDSDGMWCAHENERPQQAGSMWCSKSRCAIIAFDTSWLPDLPWRESLLENPNWSDAPTPDTCHECGELSVGVDEIGTPQCAAHYRSRPTIPDMTGRERE